jgi:poly(3-hydroxybutyrate) depolymerase
MATTVPVDLAMLPLALALALATQGPQVTLLRVADTLLSGAELLEYEIRDGAMFDTFGLFEPIPQATPPAEGYPLLVLFHAFDGYGVGELQYILYAHSFMQEADDRRWFILAPAQIDQSLGTFYQRKTFGNDAAVERIRAELAWVLDTYPIDRRKVYGFGFSMGGGDVLSFAAQHRDPTAGAFAAVAVNAPTSCLSAEYWWNQNAQDPLERAIGGGPGVPPPMSPWDFARASSTLRASAHPWASFFVPHPQPARNLAGTLVQAWIHVQDAPDRLIAVDELEDALTLWPSGVAFQRFDVTLPYFQYPHEWRTFDAQLVCTAFEQRTLAPVLAAEYVVSRDARYGEVGILRHNPNAFGILAHDFRNTSGPQPIVRFDRLQNIRRVTFDGAAHHLGVPFEVELGSRREAVELVVQNVDQPSLVVWNLAAVSTWSYDLPRRTLTLQSPRGRGGVWHVL